MEPCTTYQNTHHQSTVVIGSQRGKTCWPFMFMLMSNIKQYKTVLNINIPQMNLFLPSRNSTVETISKQLEYVTKGHVATQTILLQI